MVEIINATSDAYIASLEKRVEDLSIANAAMERECDLHKEFYFPYRYDIWDVKILNSIKLFSTKEKLIYRGDICNILSDIRVFNTSRRQESTHFEIYLYKHDNEVWNIHIIKMIHSSDPSLECWDVLLVTDVENKKANSLICDKWDGIIRYFAKRASR